MSNKYGVWSVAVLGMKEQLLKDIEGMDYNFEDDGDEVCWITEEGYRVYRQYVIGF